MECINTLLSSNAKCSVSNYNLTSYQFECNLVWFVIIKIYVVNLFSICLFYHKIQQSAEDMSYICSQMSL